MPIETIEHLFIPLADGTRLAARMWRPADAAVRPVPAVLEYIPYRKRDGTRARDEPMHAYFAARGYAALRVDMRGSGDSDGHLADEYLPQEQDDALEVIAWIAAQPWCTGAVGMMGKSWGGFNALQVAARRPAALQAIITVCSTDDRFADDIHYMGGCLLNDNLWWGSIMLAYQARPPDPDIIGTRWREQWLARLERMPFWPALWLAHQRRDAYWRHGSVCEDYGAIACPVLAVGGWADAYTNAVLRLLEHLQVPRLGIIGPWAHIYPHDGVPGPAIGFLQEAARWWDAWLKGIDTGVTREPMLRAFIEEFEPPSATRKTVSGRFIAEETWPSPNIAERPFFLADGRLADAAPPPARLPVRSPLYAGSACGEWMGTGIAGEAPGDQRMDDGLSLTFDSAPLSEAFDMLGFPAVELELTCDAPQGQIAVRLCDVAPDGASLRVSYAVLNLTHRAGSNDPRPLTPGETVRLRLPLKACGHRFPPGHRLRLAISTSYWPLVWPVRERATLTILAGASRLLVPVRRSGAGEVPCEFPPPERSRAAPQTVVRAGRTERSVTFDQIDGTAAYVTKSEGGLFGEGVVRLDEIGITLSHDLARRLTIAADDPLSAEAVIEQTYVMERQGWKIEIRTSTKLHSNAESFRLTGILQAYENASLVHESCFDERLARDFL